jgi:hypothetical protein
VVAAPALLALATVTFLLPARLALSAPPGSAAWDGAHQRWAALLGLALVAFVLASRDPAHRRLPRPVRMLARGRARCHACGKVSGVDLRCAHRGEPMHAHDVDPLPGPGAAV